QSASNYPKASCSCCSMNCSGRGSFRSMASAWLTAPGLQTPHLEIPPLDLPCLQPQQRLMRHAAFHGHVGLVVEQGDLADLVGGEAGVAGEGAEDVAGAHLVLATAADVEGDHRRAQQFAGVV